MISSTTGHLICEHRLCNRIKEHLASFLNDPSETYMESEDPLRQEEFLDIFDYVCFDGEFRRFVERRNNPEESLMEDYRESHEDRRRIQSNSFNQPINALYQERFEQLLAEEGFEEKMDAIEAGRSYKGQSAIYEGLLADQEGLRVELEQQEKAIFLLLAENENLKKEIQASRAVAASFMKSEKEFGGG